MRSTVRATALDGPLCYYILAVRRMSIVAFRSVLCYTDTRTELTTDRLRTAQHKKGGMDMDKIQELIDLLRDKKDEDRPHLLLWIVGVIGAVCAIAAVAYAVYRYFTPDYLEDFEDEDFEDDFDDYFEDEEVTVLPAKKEEPAEEPSKEAEAEEPAAEAGAEEPAAEAEAEGPVEEETPEE